METIKPKTTETLKKLIVALDKRIESEPSYQDLVVRGLICEELKMYDQALTDFDAAGDLEGADLRDLAILSSVALMNLFNYTDILDLITDRDICVNQDELDFILDIRSDLESLKKDITLKHFGELRFEVFLREYGFVYGMSWN